MINSKVLAFLFLFFFSPAAVWAYWVWSPEQGKFVNTEGGAQDDAEAQYEYAMQLHREGNLDDAAKQLETVVKKYPTSRVTPEAQYRVGTIYEEKSDYLKAFKAYKFLIETYPQTDRLNEVIEREYRIANLFYSGKKNKLMGLEILPSMPKAVEIYKHIVEQAPYSDYGDDAQFRLGLTYRKMGKFNESVEAFQALIDQYPQSELVPETRFQLAETSYQRSAIQFRDQRALEDASKQVDRFLTRHPDADASEKAARLRQQIDEKNAEKNYRIGLYYEKTDYLNSALIYYSDVARRYPHTLWGQKAQTRMDLLKQPVSYHSEELEKIDAQILLLKTEMEALPKDAEVERSQIKRKIERLEADKKKIGKSQDETFKSRERDLKRREIELKEKYKRLEQKRKLLSKNPSNDLDAAFQRWEASLEAERAAIEEEKRQLLGWEESLALGDEGGFFDFLPFVGSQVPEVEQVRRVDAKEYYKISHQKREILSEKELLYKQHSEVLGMLKGMDADAANIAASLESQKSLEEQVDLQLGERKKNLAEVRKEMLALEKELEEKESVYEEYYGTGWTTWIRRSLGLVASSTGTVSKPVIKSFDLLNPFGAGSENLDQLEIEELLERQMHLKEKIAAQKGLVTTLTQAFDTELALQERKRLSDQLQDKSKVDPQELRKSIRQLEKDIRGRYEEIKDRHHRKRELLEELDGLLKQHEEKMTAMEQAVNQVTKPAKKVVGLSKAFIFGLPQKDERLTDAADKASLSPEESEEAMRIREELEKESIVIEAREKEIRALQQELEILEAKASLAGGYQYRSAMVRLPYSFIREAVDSANRLVPEQGREEVIIQLIDKETKEMDVYRSQLEAVNAEIGKRSGEELLPPVEEKPVVSKRPIPPGAPSEEQMKSEIEKIAKAFQEKQQAYESIKASVALQQRALEGELEAGQVSKTPASTKSLTKKEKSLLDELSEIEEELQQLIKRESELEEEETGILSKRIKKIESIMDDNISRATVQDLIVERERIEDRLKQLELRRDFLSKELQRFQHPKGSI